MTKPTISEFLSDPLSVVARKERRNILIASTVGFFVATMDFVPTRISMLGIQFTSVAQNSFIMITAIVVTYFIIAFIIYGVSDFVIWRERYQEYLLSIETESQNWDQDDQQAYDELQIYVPDIHWLYDWSKPITIIRMFFEFVLPVFVGVTSIFMLVLKL